LRTARWPSAARARDARLYQQRVTLFLCSTIIETGIVPTANTIIIDRADRFGLAQLHQLRGRVGRCIIRRPSIC
jgi:transcription-repair coupling factor (superfamily II helicase)